MQKFPNHYFTRFSYRPFNLLSITILTVVTINSESFIVFRGFMPQPFP